MSSSDLISHLYRAASTPRGIRLECETPEDVTRLRQKLYALIAKNPEFSNISLIPHPFSPLELLVINKEPANGDN